MATVLFSCLSCEGSAEPRESTSCSVLVGAQGWASWQQEADPALRGSPLYFLFSRKPDGLKGQSLSLTRILAVPGACSMTKRVSSPALSCCFFYSVAKSCSTLCSPVDCSTPGFPVLHHLPEFAQTHVCWVSDAIQSSHLLPPPSPPASIFPSFRVFSSESALRIR